MIDHARSILYDMSSTFMAFHRITDQGFRSLLSLVCIWSQQSGKCWQPICDASATPEDDRESWTMFYFPGSYDALPTSAIHKFCMETLVCDVLAMSYCILSHVTPLVKSRLISPAIVCHWRSARHFLKWPTTKLKSNSTAKHLWIVFAFTKSFMTEIQKIFKFHWRETIHGKK